MVGDAVHSTVRRVLGLLGLGRSRPTVLPVDGQGRIRADKLPRIAGPTIVCIQAGNVNTGTLDPARELCEWAKEAGAWVHVDGAFGSWARASRYRCDQADGLDLADSWATDAHQQLNVPYDCGLALVPDERAQILNEVKLNQVLVAFGADERTNGVIAEVQEAGVCWCGGTRWQGRTAMRVSVSSWATTEDDIDASVIAILDAVEKVRRSVP